MKTIGTNLLIAGTVLVGAVWLVDTVQTFESHYDTYHALQESELMTHGWVSHVIPKSSYDIRETHRVSGGIVAVQFKFQPDDMADMESRCTGLTTGDPMMRQYQCLHDGVRVVVKLEGPGQGQIRIE